MSDYHGRERGHRPPWRGRTRVLVLTAAAGLALLATACSASTSTSGPGGSTSGGPAASTGTSASAGTSGGTGGQGNFPSAAGYSSCMRSHGVPEYPGPDSSGNLPKIDSSAQVGVSAPVFAKAQTSCQSLWPYQALNQGQLQQELTEAVKFAACMRSHGVPNWPDPTTNSASGRVEFVISTSKDGFNVNSQQIADKASVCEKGVPASMLPGSPTGVEVSQTS